MGGAKKEGGMDTCCSHTGPRLPGGEESPHCMKHLGQGSANYVYIRVSGPVLVLYQWNRATHFSAYFPWCFFATKADTSSGDGD